MKHLNVGKIINLILGLFLFLALAQASEVLAAEYYTYQDARGNLVISNKKPPEGSKILKTQDLPEAADSENDKTSKTPAVPNTEKGSDNSKQK